MKGLLSAPLLFAALYAPAQSAETGTATLQRARHLQDAPFARGLQSFTCAVDFSWPQHFKETPRVGDEGTDEQIRTLIQPIKTRVTVTSRAAVPASNLNETEEQHLPHGGMAEGLLKHAVEFSLNQWLMAANNALLPAESPVTADISSTAVQLHFTMQGAKAQALLTPDLRLQRLNAEGNDGDRLETNFMPGPNGFLLTSLAVGEDGNFTAGNRIVATYTYKAVTGFQLPAQVVLSRESHHEVWRYKLTGCSVVTSK